MRSVKLWQNHSYNVTTLCSVLKQPSRPVATSAPGGCLRQSFTALTLLFLCSNEAAFSHVPVNALSSFGILFTLCYALVIEAD